MCVTNCFSGENTRVYRLTFTSLSVARVAFLTHAGIASSPVRACGVAVTHCGSRRAFVDIWWSK